MSLKESILCLIFLMKAATIQRTRLKKEFAVYSSDTPVTLKQGQGHKTCMNWQTVGKVIIKQSLKKLA